MTLYNFEQNSPIIDKTAYIAPQTYISGRVTIKKYSSIWPMSVLRGDISTISIGKFTNIQDGSILHVTHASIYNNNIESPLMIGDYVTIGHGSILHACCINHKVLIGMGSTVLDGAVIEEETIVGAGSLITPNKHLESGYLWAGAPAKKMRELTDSEREFLVYSAKYYKKLAQRTKIYN